MRYSFVPCNIDCSEFYDAYAKCTFDFVQHFEYLRHKENNALQNRVRKIQYIIVNLDRVKIFSKNRNNSQSVVK